jgi:hypothetical protein
MESDLLDTADAAALAGTSPAYLANMRWLDRGPTYVKRRGRVYYRRSTLLAWLRLRGQR